MKTKLLLIALLSVLSLGANTININPGVLANEPEVAFKGGASMVRIENGDFFKMKALGDRVEMQSVSNKDWSFDNKVIYPSELNLSDLLNFNEEDILTITATALHDNSTQYAVGLIKYMDKGRLSLRVVSAYTIPEPSTFALLAGMLAFTHIALKRRRV
jgi:hypothetical protein